MTKRKTNVKKYRVITKNRKKYLVFGKRLIPLKTNLTMQELKKVVFKYFRVLSQKPSSKTSKNSSNMEQQKSTITGSTNRIGLEQQDIRDLQKKMKEE